MASKKTVQSKIECKEQLNTELHKSAKCLAELEATQRAGDFSIELARRIFVLRYHMEVITNRINGTFQINYAHEAIYNVPKDIRK